MPDTLSSNSEKAGLPPGSLIHIGEVRDAEPRITVVDYTKDAVEEHVVQSVEQIAKFKDTKSITWVNIEGLKNVELVEAIGRYFNIHPLVLEDILNTRQRPKLEEHDNYLFIVLKGLALQRNHFSVEYEQISILVLDYFVFTFKEKRDELFAPILRRLKDSKGRFRSQGADYLTYVILDTVVDSYFSLQDSFDEILDSLEDELLSNPTKKLLEMIQRAKRELIFVRRSVSPLREVLNTLLRSESALIDEHTQVYFRDVYDHAIRISEAVESYRDILGGLLDIYISSVSNKMNEIMKVLTVFASIFIPLTFIAGIYGMNFEYMPELKWRWAYPVLWAVFVAIPIVLLVYFKRKKWL
jgi:magnesium transporter